MKHQVSELTGALLDAAVAQANGLPWRLGNSIDHGPMSSSRADGPHCIIEGLEGWYPASTNWGIAGPIIQRELIVLHTDEDGMAWSAWSRRRFGLTPAPAQIKEGRTPLIAAMRAYCQSKFGEEVEL